MCKSSELARDRRRKSTSVLCSYNVNNTVLIPQLIHLEIIATFFCKYALAAIWDKVMQVNCECSHLDLRLSLCWLRHRIESRYRPVAREQVYLTVLRRSWSVCRDSFIRPNSPSKCILRRQVAAE